MSTAVTRSLRSLVPLVDLFLRSLILFKGLLSSYSILAVAVHSIHSQRYDSVYPLLNDESQYILSQYILSIFKIKTFVRG